MAGERKEDFTNPELPDALHEAQILVSYAAEAGHELDQATIRIVVESTAQMRDQGALGTDQEVAFWAAFNKLCKTVSPISLSSLRATMDSYSPTSRMLGFDIGSRSKARAAVYKYTLGLTLTLAILLLTQVYWLFGNWIVTDIHRQKKDVAESEAKVRTYRKDQTAQVAAKPAALKTADAQEDPELEALTNAVRHNRLQLDASYRLLKQWSRLWEDSFGVGDICSSLAAVDPAAAQKGDPKDKAAAERRTARGASRAISCENIARHQAVAVVLETLQRYVLPLLYGLLGCCVYILRTLSSEIRTRTYTEASNIGFRIRLYLGTLGGMIVAWFVTPETADGIFKTLSPFALAFLAGYSIELVFAAMDRIINAFTGKAADAA